MSVISVQVASALQSLENLQLRNKHACRACRWVIASMLLVIQGVIIFQFRPAVLTNLAPNPLISSPTFPDIQPRD